MSKIKAEMKLTQLVLLFCNEFLERDGDTSDEAKLKQQLSQERVEELLFNLERRLD